MWTAPAKDKFFDEEISFEVANYPHMAGCKPFCNEDVLLQ